jgi:hypothetical protein
MLTVERMSMSTLFSTSARFVLEVRPSDGDAHWDQQTTGLFTVNGSSFTPTRPFVPVLLQILSGAKTAQELLPPGSVIPVPRNKVIQVSMPGRNVFQFGGPVCHARIWCISLLLTGE